MDLESVPIVPDSKAGEAVRTPRSRSVKTRMPGQHKGKFEVYGPMSSHSGTHVDTAREINKLYPQLGLAGFDSGESKKTGGDMRSAAYPGASRAIVHNPGGAAEEVYRLITRGYGRGDGSDKGAGAAKKADPSLPDTVAYHGFGSVDERRVMMPRIKAAAAEYGFDLADSGHREAFLKSLNGTTGGYDIPEEATGTLSAMWRLHEKKRKGEELKPHEKKADEDLNSDSIWKQVSRVGVGGRSGNMV